LLERDEKCKEELKKIGNSLEQGKRHKENLLKSKRLLDETSSPRTFSERVEVATQRKQILHSWSVKCKQIDTPHSLLKALKEGKQVYAEMIIKDETRNAKLTHHDEGIYLHTFLEQVVADDCIRMPFDRVQKMIPVDASLAFIELSIGGSVKGRVYVRLNKEMPNIRDNFIHIVTGKRGPTLTGVKFNGKNSYGIAAGSLPFTELRFTRDSIEKTKAKRGDVIGCFYDGYLQHLEFFVAAPPITIDYPSYWSVFGHVEAGMDVVLECHDKFDFGITVSDSGLVLEH
ncbi:unnamed protein product, partial [Meganyctiphanes norvegica]